MFFLHIYIYIHLYIYIYIKSIYIYISIYPRPSKGQVKLGRYTNSRPLPKDHYIYIYIFFGDVDLGHLGIYVDTRGNPPSPTDTPQPQQQQLLINQFQVYKCQDCLKWVFQGHFTVFFRGRFTDFSRSRFCGKFQVGTFTRSFSVLYLVTSWSKMQTFAQSLCSQAHFTCIELNQMAFFSTYLLTIISQHAM